MFGMRPSAAVVSVVVLASLAAACGSNQSDKPSEQAKPIAGTIVVSECINSGWTRRVRLIDAKTHKVIRTNFFNVNAKEFQSLGDCASIFSGQEQRAVFNDDYSLMLAVRSINYLQYFGWIGRTDTSTGTVNGETPFQSEMNVSTDRGTLFGGVYDRSGSGKIYYVEQTGDDFQLFVNDGQSGHSVKDLSSKGTHNVFLPVGSRTPQPIDNDLNLPACTAFKGSYGFASQGLGVQFGSQDEIYGGKADIALGDQPAPCPLKTLNKKQYIGFNNTGFFQAAIDGNKASFTKLLNVKDASSAVPGPNNTVAFSVSDGTTTKVYASSLDKGSKPKLITSTTGQVQLLEFSKQ